MAAVATTVGPVRWQPGADLRLGNIVKSSLGEWQGVGSAVDG